MNEKRFREMLAINDNIQRELVEFLPPIQKNELPGKQTQLDFPEENFKFKLLKDRLKQHKPLLKAYFAVKAHDYLLNTTFDDTHHYLYGQLIPFTVEVAMTVQYYDNQIWDGKSGVITPLIILENDRMSIQLMDDFIWYLRTKEQNGVDRNTIKIIEEEFLYTLKIVDYGQFTEKQNNRYENFIQSSFHLKWSENMDKVLNNDALTNIKVKILEVAPEIRPKEDFLDWHLKRVFFTGAYTYLGNIKILENLLNIGNPEQYYEIYNFACYYGIMMQVVNDLTDFVPTSYNTDSVTKNKTNSFSDVKTKNITIPIMIHLLSMKNSYLERKIKLEEFDLNENDENIILREMIDSGSYEKTVAICKSIRKLAIESLDKANINTPDLVDMCDVVFTNKFVNFLRPYKRYLSSENS